MIVAVAHQPLIDERDHHAGAQVDEERRAADADDGAHHLEAVSERVQAEAQIGLRPRVVHQQEGQRHRLRADGAQGGSADAHAQPEDEQRVEAGIDDHGRQRGGHGPLRIARGARHVVEAHVDVRHYVAQQDDLHVFARIGQTDFAGAEEGQDAVEEQQRHYGEHRADD